MIPTETAVETDKRKVSVCEVSNLQVEQSDVADEV